MATVEEIDEAEQLRFLALKSMVRRSSKKNTNNTDTDDQDILLLRAAALKTINNKSSQGNKDEKIVNNQLINEKKRSISSQVSPLVNKKNIKLTDMKNNNLVNNVTNNTNTGNITRVSKHHLEQVFKNKHKLETNIESQSKSEVINNKDDIKKIIRNGSIQLSNLDSEKFNETMILHITFSSSESDDSSSESDVAQNKVSIPKKNINNGALRSPAPTLNVDHHVKATDTKSLEDNKLKMNNCMQQICGLMRHCESEIEKRNQQVEILLQAYEKYQNYSESLRSILHSMKTVRDELSLYSSAEH
ncbi:putative uncharacterized protein DDB_G0292292 [Rhopalosiphum maidis]|uniref:putative uncharacterized protein DDB_G0292292 n=1 Tax=Rhopalosiphum maidis TaxID=43146 RepID=UPI000EFEDA86|nr:putative uncharacterized protein DDB_G0292292 [Rhopalosiphum maidis]XP_026817081.1 putative uncharacterized protein DDB_G0292292 [Rhopalosiphum maidis]XP_026817082.1 putative uncharacterized protein DDB_G0292292 [Rhopalosiphum maidis]XP_026817083.1 putative uncharacterized protein DDB_G0292292 [Rhopalosiphum maidis]